MMKPRDKLTLASNSPGSVDEEEGASTASLAERVRQLRNAHGRPPGWPFPAPRVRQPDPDRSPPTLEPEP